MENKFRWSTVLHPGMQMCLTGHQKCYKGHHVLQMQISVATLNPVVNTMCKQQKHTVPRNNLEMVQLKGTFL